MLLVYHLLGISNHRIIHYHWWYPYIQPLYRIPRLTMTGIGSFDPSIPAMIRYDLFPGTRSRVQRECQDFPRGSPFGPPCLAGTSLRPSPMDDSWTNVAGRRCRHRLQRLWPGGDINVRKNIKGYCWKKQNTSNFSDVDGILMENNECERDLMWVFSVI